MEVMTVETCIQVEVQEVLPKEKQQITKATVLIKETVGLKAICLLPVGLVLMVILQNLPLHLNLK